MKLHGRIKSGRIVMSPQMIALRDNYVSRLKDDTPVTVDIKRITRSKSNQQVKCHWGLVVGMVRQQLSERGIDLATFVGSKTIPVGLEIPAQVIHLMLEATCNAVGENGERKDLSVMDTIEASRFFENCRVYAAGAWDIQIPDPDPRWFEKKKKGKA